MKNSVFTFVLLMLTSIFSFSQGTLPWEETYQFEPLADQKDGGSVSVDITNEGKDIKDCQQKARSQALYTIIFKGYPKTNNASATSKLAEMSVYQQNKDFFINYLTQNSAGLNWVNKFEQNFSKPGGKLDKKTIRTTTTVYINKAELRADLEKNGMIQSAKSIAESLGITPSIMIVPSNQWMKSAEFTKEVESNIGTTTQYNYREAIDDKKMVLFRSIEGFLDPTFQGLGFRVQNITSVLNNISKENLANSLRSTGIQEDPMDLLAKTANADLWFHVDLVEEELVRNEKFQYQIKINAIDPLLGESVVAGKPQTISTSGGNKLALIETTVNAVIDDMIPRVIEYFKERDEKGLQGKMIFMMGDGVSVNFDDEINIDGDEYAFADVIDAMVSKNAINSSPDGNSPTRRAYNVMIPTKTQNKLSGKVEPYNYEKFARKVKSEVQKVGGLKAIVESHGLGKVYVIFTEEK